ncbi:MAG: UbiA family prenyltransferase [Candidatus Zixiibacteriota bacterium]|nr:MAG: UbiA family prenyltransferase [candidate division Zixibacteria bacterium]
MILLDYIFAARPMLHLPLWSVYLVSLHYHHRLSGETFTPADLLVMTCLSLVASGSYYINQVYDYDSDRINGKLGFLLNGLVREQGLWSLFLVLSVVSVGLAVFLSWSTALIMVALFVLGFFYSAPPFRLKDRPAWGLLINAVGIGFIVPLAVMPDLNVHNIGLLGWDSPLFFLFSVGSIYILTTLPDREGDRAVGKRTLAVVLPGALVAALSLVLMMLSAWVAYYSGHRLLLYLSLMSTIIILPVLPARSDRFTLFAAKFPVLLLTLLAGYLFWSYLLFVVAIVIGTRIYYRRRFAVVYPKLA